VQEIGGNKGKVQRRKDINRLEKKRERFFEERKIKRKEVEEKSREEENWINKI